MATRIAQTVKADKAPARRGISAKSYLKKVESPASCASARKAATTETCDVDVSAICQRIERKAYELFEKRGYGHGNDVNDWLEAEKIVNQGLSKN
jgi:hypothetical protein